MGDRPVIDHPSCCRLSATISAARHVFPVRLSIKREAFTPSFCSPNESWPRIWCANFAHEVKIPHQNTSGSEFFEGGPSEEEVFGALGREVDDSLGLVARTRNVDDDALTERTVFDSVTHP